MMDTSKNLPGYPIIVLCPRILLTYLPTCFGDLLWGVLMYRYLHEHPSWL